jgi:hypothetical protein
LLISQEILTELRLWRHHSMLADALERLQVTDSTQSVLTFDHSELKSPPLNETELAV